MRYNALKLSNDKKGRPMKLRYNLEKNVKNGGQSHGSFLPPLSMGVPPPR